MGAPTVPMSKVPPALTVMFPPTNVIVLVAVRLNWSVPLMVVVLATALLASIVTVVPAAITTGLQA